MDLMLGLAATVLAIFVYLYAFMMIVIVSRLVKLQLWEQIITPVERAEAGEELVVFDAARALLEQAGFRYVSTRRMRSLVASPSTFPAHSDLYYHPEHDVHADVVTASMPTPRWPFDIYLWNAYTDGTTLLTVNGLAHALIPYPRSYTIADPYAPNFQLQLAAHLARRGTCSGTRCNPADAPSLALYAARALLIDMEAEGSAYRSGALNGDPIYRLRLVAAIKMAWRMRAGAARRKAIDAPQTEGDTQPKEAAPDVRHATERVAFMRTLCTLNGMQAPRWFRWSAFAVSAGGFIALGSWWWGLAAALVIAAVIAVHEAGHWLAMKLAKFRDVQVFFVPSMGAATSGEKHEDNPLTHLAVYLAGPVPGLLLAVAAFAWMVFAEPDASAWWYSALAKAASVSFIINLLNLLPVMPLDGGRVVDLFVMGRLPWLRFGFALASGALLMWTGFALDDNLLRGLGLLYLLSVPHQYRMARVSRDLLRQTSSAALANEDFGTAAARLFDFLAQPTYRKWNHQTKVAIGQAILPRFLGRLPSAREAVLGTVIYIACIVAPLLALGALALKNPERIAGIAFGAGERQAPLLRDVPANGAADAFVKKLRDQRNATLAAASGPTQRIEVLAQVIDDAGESADYEDALRLSRILYDETAQLPPPARARADAAVRLVYALLQSDEEGASAQSPRLLDDAEATLRALLAKHADSADALLLARVLQARLTAGDRKNPLPLRQEITDLHAAHWEQSGPRLPTTRIALALVLDQAGQADAAEKQLHLAADDLKRLPSAAQYARDGLMLDTAWFLMAHQRPGEALKLLAPFLVTDAGLVQDDFQINRDAYLLAAVAARSRGDWQEVKARMSAIYQTPKADTGNKIMDLFLASRLSPSRLETRASLLLVEAERKLGKNERANELVATLQKQNPGPGGYGRCRFKSTYEPWREALMAAISENEKRELKCTEPAACIL